MLALLVAMSCDAPTPKSAPKPQRMINLTDTNPGPDVWCDTATGRLCYTYNSRAIWCEPSVEVPCR